MHRWVGHVEFIKSDQCGKAIEVSDKTAHEDIRLKARTAGMQDNTTASDDDGKLASSKFSNAMQEKYREQIESNEKSTNMEQKKKEDSKVPGINPGKGKCCHRWKAGARPRRAKSHSFAIGLVSWRCLTSQASMASGSCFWN